MGKKKRYSRHIQKYLNKPSELRQNHQHHPPSVQIRSISQAAQSGRLETSWPSFPTSIDAHIYQEWLTLVARSRYEAENYDHFRKFIQLVGDSVAGPSGFNLNAQIRDTEGKMDTFESKAIEFAYEDFSKKGNFDTTGTLSRSDAERMALTTWRKGNYNSSVREKYPHGIAFRFIDPILLDPTHYHKLNNGNIIRHGIEMDEDNRPIAYHFQDQEERNFGYSIGYNTTWRIPAENIIHWFLPERIGCNH